MLKKLQLVLGADGKIYLASLTKEGHMSTTVKKEVTKDAMRVVMEYFMSNNFKMGYLPERIEGNNPTLFFVNDEDTAKTILKLLQNK
ncbi:hypothetical protein KLP99_001621 [Listeria monocytogenes]|nr:hypothetical protein [Listeria monocytogenes]